MGQLKTRRKEFEEVEKALTEKLIDTKKEINKHRDIKTRIQKMIGLLLEQSNIRKDLSVGCSVNLHSHPEQPFLCSVKGKEVPLLPPIGGDQSHAWRREWIHQWKSKLPVYGNTHAIISYTPTSPHDPPSQCGPGYLCVPQRGGVCLMSKGGIVFAKPKYM
eukprot:GHVO01032432.1.p1 GENE.GHVO01032432.1~~GHVO01032432.1.p1  ORF type:complete len:171 (+),score=29.51 GHVO01032432.1:32-514(+)